MLAPLCHFPATVGVCSGRVNWGKLCKPGRHLCFSCLCSFSLFIHPSIRKAAINAFPMVSSTAFILETVERQIGEERRRARTFIRKRQWFTSGPQASRLTSYL